MQQQRSITYVYFSSTKRIFFGVTIPRTVDELYHRSLYHLSVRYNVDVRYHMFGYLEFY